MALSIAQIMSQLKGGMESFVQQLPAGGKVSVATDPFNVFELLRAGPRAYLVILNWAGAENFNDIDVIPLFQHRIEVVFGANLGLTVAPDHALIAGKANRPAIWESLDDLTATLLALQFQGTDTQGLLGYVRTEPVVTPEGIPLAAYRLIFNLRAVPTQPTQPIAI